MQKELIHITDPKIIKILKKSFTKRILDSFEKDPKTAGQIANSISFPKEKIYYHIKNLVKLDILFIASTEMVKGIEQKLYLPTYKQFVIKNEKQKPKENQIKKTFQINNSSKDLDNEKVNIPTPISAKRKINERRRISERRISKRRLPVERRKKSKKRFIGVEKRILLDRRLNKEQRGLNTRRELVDRRFESNPQPLGKEYPIVSKRKNVKSFKHKNILLRLNGIRKAMTFVHTGNRVTFLLCDLKTNGFQIERMNNYSLPMKLKESTIYSLTDLIINITTQFIDSKERKKVYLAVHSDLYQFEMTYLSAKGKNERLFEKDLYNTLYNSYGINNDHSLVDYVQNSGKEKNAVVCLSNKRAQINKDYHQLKSAGIQPRYYTSIPQILRNIYTYYNLDQQNDFSLLIYIDRDKTHIVFMDQDRLFESKETNKGLNYFLNALVELNSLDIDELEAESNALHYLAFYGIRTETQDAKILDGIPHEKAKSILAHLINDFIEDIKDSINYFENILLHDGYIEQVIKTIYICGVGSHVKGLQETIEEDLKAEVNNLSNYNTTFLEKQNQFKDSGLGRLKTTKLSKRKENTENQLELVKKRINDHEKAIESARSPESAKYRLTRIELEKDLKLRSIESAKKKLIKSSKEFKNLKEEYKKTQEILKADLDSVYAMIEDKSSILIDKYEDHDRIGKKISELEYESDQSTPKNEDRLNLKEQYGSRVKIAAKNRIRLGDEKENLDQEIDEYETTIIELEETLYLMNQKLENGQDEISIFEYLKDSIQSTANAFKRSFLERLRKTEDLSKDDLNALQQSGYLLIQNTKRMNEIRESFSAMISGESHINPDLVIADDIGLEIRKKLLKILNLVILVPDNLIHLKNLTESIIKINESQKELLENEKLTKNKIKLAKNSERLNERDLIAIRKEIDISEKDLSKKGKDRQEQLELLIYIRETMDMINEIEHHTVLVKELTPQKKKYEKEIKEISDRIIRLNSLAESSDKAWEVLDVEQKELAKSFNQEKESINNKNNKLLEVESSIKRKIDDLINKKEIIDKREVDSSVYIKQLETQVLSKKKEIEDLEIEKRPLQKKFFDEKKSLVKKFNKQIALLDNENKLKINESKKTETLTINKFFKKERLNLEKKHTELQRSLEKTKKDKEKAKTVKDNAQKSLKVIKKKNIPKINELRKKIKSWEKDLSQGRRFQERLDILERKKRDWDERLDYETKRNDEKINELNDSVKRKKSAAYRLFLKDGLRRLKNDGDAEQLAINMVEDSLALDFVEIKKIEEEKNLYLKQYDAFMKGYRKTHKSIMEKLRPYGGRKQTIISRMNNAKKKIHQLELSIKNVVNKLDQKNELLIKTQKKLIEANKKLKSESKIIQSDLNNIPLKMENAKSDVKRKLKEKLTKLSKERDELEARRIEKLRSLEMTFNNQSIVMSVKKAEDKMIFFFSEIEKSKKKINVNDKERKEILKTISMLESDIGNIFRKFESNQDLISKKEKQFENELSILKDKIDSNRSEFSILSQQIQILDKQEDELKTKCASILENYDLSKDKIKNLEKKISFPKSKSNKTIKTNSRKNRKEQLQYLTQMERDTQINIERSENFIKDLNILIDKMRNEESEKVSSINLLSNDVEYFNTDLSRIDTLVENNKQHILKLSTDHRQNLNTISNIKDLYPSSKTMLNQRITNLYTLLELKTNDRDLLLKQLQKTKEDLKNKRVEAAMLDQELSKINEKMKNALESSFYEDEKDSEWKWEISDNKLSSYMDLAQLKTQSKGISNSILETEEEIAKLKNKEASINNVITETEKINHKKIKKMEEQCTKLELQVTKEKNQITALEQEVKQISGIAFNYGDRIQALEEELDNFREKQTTYELMLQDYDRSLESVKIKSKEMMESRGGIKGNSIDIDYLANLGLLMDLDLHLNILPKSHKKEFKYFRPNQILQNGILVLFMVFSTGAFLHRSKAQSLESILPIKKSELNLLNMRQEMKGIVEEKNSIADKFGLLIDDDIATSEDMLSLLKYLSNILPQNFKVTDLTLKKNQADIINQSIAFDPSGISMVLKGFYEKDMSKSSGFMKKLEKKLKNSKYFKNIEISKAIKMSKNKTGYTIRINR
tara:strand:- start:6979 stop:13290 length:6312 start_codon:yes stop_codon:yes gene_type:complete